jgi:hypothetical protein
MKKLTTLSLIAISLLSLIALFSCRVMLVPEYSAKLEEEIAKAAKANDKLYIDLLDAAPDKRSYEAYKERYNDIESDINAIRLKNEARNKNEDFLKIITNLKEGFSEAKQYHKDKNTLKDGEIRAYQSTLSALWKPLYIAERSLKINEKK